MDRENPTESPGTNHLSIDLEGDLVIALDRFIAELHPGISRAEALALALRDWADQHGYVGPRRPIRPEDLNASNDD